MGVCGSGQELLAMGRIGQECLKKLEALVKCVVRSG